MKNVADTRRLGQIVRQARKNQKLTQVQLSAACGVGVRFIRELEQGKPSCHMAKALQVISMLGMSIFIEGHADK